MSEFAVTDIALHRRRAENVLNSVTFFFGGRHCGTFAINAAYTPGMPIRLYVAPLNSDAGRDDFRGPLDCLVTDDSSLVVAGEAAR